MATISIKELHERTGEWVRKAAVSAEITVTDRGVPVARIVPMVDAARPNPFLRRRLLPQYAAIMNKQFGGKSVTELLSEDRNGE